MEAVVEKSKKARVVSNPLQEKLDKMIASAATRVNPVLSRIEDEGSRLKDFIAPLGVTAKNGPAVTFGVDNGLRVIFKGEQHGLHRHAVTQAAEKLGVPTAYARNLAYGEDSWEQGLIAHILNEHSHHTDRRNVLLRMVGDEVRGVLSDKYRRLDTTMIYEQFFVASKGLGAKVVEAFADDTRSWVDVMLPQVFTIPTENNGDRTLAFGARIGNSDFGDGKLTLSTYNIELICMNGMTRNSVISQVHLGRQIPENIRISNQTYMADTRAQALLVRDAMRGLLDANTIREQALEIQAASSIIIADPIREIEKLRNRGVSKTETENVLNAFASGDEAKGLGGKSTVLKLANAVNWVANEVKLSSGASDERRKRELQDLAGELMLTKK